MQIIQLDEKLNFPVVVCLGFFGCMHKGHVELLNTAKQRAKQTGSKVALFTFSNNHLAVLNREQSVVYTFEERLSIYKSLGVDCVITAQFDNAFKNLTAQKFLSQFTKFDLRGIVCGFDHLCGSDRLDCYGIKRFFENVCPVDIVNQISVDGQKVSTTLLRRCLVNNEIAKANSLLSEPFFVIGQVVHGRGMGSTLGFPTANLSIPAEKLLPVGVFGGTTQIDGKIYRAIVNIGNVPTFEVDKNTFEAHILDYNGDLYGKTLKVSLTRYLRPIKKFNSAYELGVQLQKDKEIVSND